MSTVIGCLQYTLLWIAKIKFDQTVGVLYKKSMLNINMYIYSTVVPVFRGHLCDKEKVAL